jgi:hypothetical protein
MKEKARGLMMVERRLTTYLPYIQYDIVAACVSSDVGGKTRLKIKGVV